MEGKRDLKAGVALPCPIVSKTSNQSATMYFSWWLSTEAIAFFAAVKLQYHTRQQMHIFLSSQPSIVDTGEDKYVSFFYQNLYNMQGVRATYENLYNIRGVIPLLARCQPVTSGPENKRNNCLIVAADAVVEHKLVPMGSPHFPQSEFWDSA